MKEKTKQALRCIGQFLVAFALMGWLAYAFTSCSAGKECPAYSQVPTATISTNIA